MTDTQPQQPEPVGEPSDADKLVPEAEVSDAPSPNGDAPQQPAPAAAAPFEVPDTPTLQDLRRAYVEPERPNFQAVKARYEAQSGPIIEQYYATTTPAAVVIVGQHNRRKWLEQYQLKMYNHGSARFPQFNKALRDAQDVLDQASPLLRKRSQRALVRRIYNLVSDMLNTLDSATDLTAGGTVDTTAITEATESAQADLVEIQKAIDKAAKASAVGWYLLGLPCGALVGYAGIWLLWKFPFAVVANNGVNVNRQLGLCLAFGAIGAMVSVMTRATRRQSVRVDVGQGRPLTMVAGGFRTIVGAIFGAILYVLVVGGLLPLETPGAAGKDAVLFFAGLAFVAGFSERWAQDTILRSAPTFGTANGTGPQGGDGD